jgi:hypothetical protein
MGLDPVSLLSRLAAVPYASYHMVRYAGVPASASKFRSRIALPPPSAATRTPVATSVPPAWVQIAPTLTLPGEQPKRGRYRPMGGAVETDIPRRRVALPCLPRSHAPARSGHRGRRGAARLARHQRIHWAASPSASSRRVRALRQPTSRSFITLLVRQNGPQHRWKKFSTRRLMRAAWRQLLLNY